MTTSSATTERGNSQVWATGAFATAGVLLLIVGLCQMLQGLAVLADDGFLLTVNGYAYRLDPAVWGWTHLAVGAAAGLTGVLVVRGRVVRTGAPLLVAALSVVSNFLFLLYCPFWSLAIIALGVAVIWALATDDRPLR